VFYDRFRQAEAVEVRQARESVRLTKPPMAAAHRTKSYLALGIAFCFRESSEQDLPVALDRRQQFVSAAGIVGVGLP